MQCFIFWSSCLVHWISVWMQRQILLHETASILVSFKYLTDIWKVKILRMCTISTCYGGWLVDWRLKSNTDGSVSKGSSKLLSSRNIWANLLFVFHQVLVVMPMSCWITILQRLAHVVSIVRRDWSRQKTCPVRSSPTLVLMHILEKTSRVSISC